MSEVVLFWHRRDLRVSDNLGLAAACDRSSKVIGIFCLDPALLDPDTTAPARVAYMVGCLQALEQRYQEAGSQLLFLQGDPTEKIPQLATALAATAIYWNRDVEPYARQRDTAVAHALKARGIEYQADFWDQLLHAPGSVLTGSNNPYTVYTPFWRNWIKQPKAHPVEPLAGAIPLTPEEVAAAQAIGARPCPTALELGFPWDGGFPIEPGEGPAQQQLAQFCDLDQAIVQYDEQRNYPAVDGTSRLSAALKFGVIGIRTVWAAAATAAQHCRSDEARQGVQTWQQELAWREFYQHVMYFFPQLAAGPYRQQWHNFPWINDEQQFEAWCQGQTGYPIVDAAMRQLRQSGWMHNRCRMIVASFLTKDLIIDWRWGEKHFMRHLVDGDLAANNGGWQWSASSGMDPKPLRIFNPASQAQKYDREADYIRHWVPELRSVETAALVSGTIDPGQCDRSGYPHPIVNHKQQQALFREKYNAQKAAIPKS